MNPLVLWGGTDVDPSLYGKTPLSFTQKPDHNRDVIEMALYTKAINEKRPIIGVCRGAQLICIMNKGTLYQHSIPTQQNHSINTLYDGMFYNVPSDHHQIMKPKGNFLYYACNPEPTKIWDSETEVREIKNTPEVVYWPETNSLAIQPHPEWCDKNDKFLHWINKLLTNLNFNYKF